MRVAVAIMAKAPGRGAVKTRLCPPLDPVEAATLYQCFLRDKIAQVRGLARVRAAIAYAPPESRALFAELASDFALLPQRGADLGARLEHTLADLLEAGHSAAIAVDSDTPTLPTEFLQRAVEAVVRPDVDVVLGPTDDGGYYLIGMRAVCHELFDGIPWSTPDVLAQTLARAAAARLRAVQLPRWFDVDTPADLVWLRASMTNLGDGAPPHTARFLARTLPGRGAARHLDVTL